MKVGNWIQDRLWGETPEGFERMAEGEKYMIVLSTRLKDSTVLRALWGPEGGNDESPYRGRSKLRSVDIAQEEPVLVRTYRRGGMVRFLTADLFFTWPPRPFVELCITEAARRKGIPTLEVLGACVERTRGPFYRGWLATRHMTGAEDLWAVLQRDAFPSPEKGDLIAGVALTIRKMHRLGLFHADLNLKNILVRREATGIQCYVIDLDKAKFYPGDLPVKQADQNLRRLLRSISKLDPGRRHLTHNDWKLFLERYADPAAGETEHADARMV